MQYKTPSYVRASGSLVGLAGPGRPGAWERDCRNGSPAAGSEAMEMRAGPVGRLAGEVGQAEGAPRAQAKARQEAARKLAGLEFETNAAAKPRRRRRAPRSGTCSVLWARWRIFEKRVSEHVCIF